METNSYIHRKIRKVGLAVCKRFPSMRKLRYVYWGERKRKFDALSAAAEIDSKMVVFEAFGGRKYVCSPKAIYEAMIADPRFDDWTFYWSFEQSVASAMREDGRAEELFRDRAKIVVRGSEEYFDVFAKAKYWIQNNRVPEYISPREDQVYVQCWHGTPLKRLGYDVPETTQGGALNSARELAGRFNADAKKWTYLLSPSPFTSEHLADAFGLPEEKRPSVILEEGYPRNDSIVNTLNAPDAVDHLARIKDSLGLPQNKKLLLFAPTWRDDQYTEGVGYTLDSLVDFKVLQESLGDEWAILLRTHYYIANKFDLSEWGGFVYNVSDVDDINDLYCIADALCTDYSSVFFDYANTDRPLLFYWPDREHYENDLHGFYIDADTLPGPKCETAEQLAEAVASLDSWREEYGVDYDKFKTMYCPKDDGRATQRVIEKIFFSG